MTPHANGTRQGAQPAFPPTWREERRLDRLAAAQAAREDAAARVQARIAEEDARDRRRREAGHVRQADRRAARRQRAARRAGCVAWLREHVTGLLFVPVIAVPALLAWTAMASFGRQVFGAAGVTLPAFSEGAMWAFAAAVTITRRRHPDRPVWHLRLGTAVFAAEGAALNFIHGAAPAAGEIRGPGIGVVMALVSVAGVVAHQLITAGPRRPRAERASARARRAAARRENAVRKAALRRTVAVLDAGGGVRLVHKPEAVALARRWHGRAALKPVPAPSSRACLPWPMMLPGGTGPGMAQLADTLAAEAMTAYRGWRSAFMAAPPRPPGAIALSASCPASGGQEADSAPDSAAAPVPPRARPGADRSVASEPDRSPDSTGDKKPDTGLASLPDSSEDKKAAGNAPAARPRPRKTAREKAAAAIARNPGQDDETIARRLRISERTVRRARGELAAAQARGPAPIALP